MMKTTKIMITSLVFAGLSVTAFGQDANVSKVSDGVTTLTNVFGLVFTLGLSVLIAMIARRYLRNATGEGRYEMSPDEAQWLAWEDEREVVRDEDRYYSTAYGAKGRGDDIES